MKSTKLSSIIWGLLVFTPAIAYAQNGYWQQHVQYKIDVSIDTEKYLVKGHESLSYKNNSPDTLRNVYFHLYYNAFQPNSMMDVRSRSLPDPDRRVRDRIFKLTPSEIGYQKISALRHNGAILDFKVEGTVMEVALNQPILPGEETVFTLDFESQIPVQIRRTGRNNKENIELSMAQWYPKMAEYDYEGWHSDPYIAREFHGVWGDFEVNITLDKEYVIGGSGVLTNPQEIGFGYEDKAKALTILPVDGKLTWKFKAENIHDFVWAADKHFMVQKTKTKNDVLLYFIHQKDPEVVAAWKKMMPYAKKGFELMAQFVGQYPYSQYSIVQGGDGGMEYGMATLINGRGGIKNFKGFCGLVFHESFHSWFQHVLATNESKFAWMDEGFTSYADEYVTHQLFETKGRIHDNTYQSYRRWATSGLEEPLSTHADYFQRNRSYGAGSYTKGAVFLYQLGYIVGEKNLNKIIKKYFTLWKFKHPTSNDFIRIAEKISNMELNWYMDYFINTTKTIDYAVISLELKESKTQITLENRGGMPMPQEVMIHLKDGTQHFYYIPLVMMRGEKDHTFSHHKVKTLPDWSWTHKTYRFEVPFAKKDIERITLDPDQKMADINPNNNLLKA